MCIRDSPAEAEGIIPEEHHRLAVGAEPGLVMGKSRVIGDQGGVLLPLHQPQGGHIPAGRQGPPSGQSQKVPPVPAV